MKVFVWSIVEKVSDRFHEDGGVVVFANSEERAREIANEIEGCNILHGETPDEVRDVIGGEEKVFIMPNAGCC